MATNVLVFCGSSYQLLVAIRIIEKFYHDDNIYLVLSDTIANVQTIYENAVKEKYFKKVYLWKTKDVFLYNKAQKIRNALLGWKYSEKVMQNFEGSQKKYDVFLYSNISDIVMHTANVLFHRNNTLKLEMFEDGFSTYSDYIGNFMDPNNHKSHLLYHVFSKTSALYLFNPSLLSWKPIMKVCPIEPEFKHECLELVNRLFSYNELHDDYNKKIIFFEESYAGDGKPIDDVDMIRPIAELVGKDNIMVKIHPRNETNRFCEEGYVTNQNTNIPWEVILLNEDFSESVFVSIASNAAMNPFFLFGMKVPAALLFRCTLYPDSLYKEIIEYDNAICSKYPEVFFIPDNKEDLLQWIKTKI